MLSQVCKLLLHGGDVRLMDPVDGFDVYDMVLGEPLDLQVLADGLLVLLDLVLEPQVPLRVFLQLLLHPADLRKALCGLPVVLQEGLLPLAVDELLEGFLHVLKLRKLLLPDAEEAQEIGKLRIGIEGLPVCLIPVAQDPVPEVIPVQNVLEYPLVVHVVVFAAAFHHIFKEAVHVVALVGADAQHQLQGLLDPGHGGLAS